jgi:hypothetical protein
MGLWSGTVKSGVNTGAGAAGGRGEGRGAALGGKNVDFNCWAPQVVEPGVLERAQICFLPQCEIWRIDRLLTQGIKKITYAGAARTKRRCRRRTLAHSRGGVLASITMEGTGDTAGAGGSGGAGRGVRGAPRGPPLSGKNNCKSLHP